MPGLFETLLSRVNQSECFYLFVCFNLVNIYIYYYYVFFYKLLYIC